MSKTFYYGRVSSTDQNPESQKAEATANKAERAFIDVGVSGFHTTPAERPEWQKLDLSLREGDILIVRWLDRISRRYDELHSVMQNLMQRGIIVRCTLNGMEFDGCTHDPIQKATRDAVLAFMAAQGEADYRNRREMQQRGIAIAKEAGKYKGRKKLLDARTVQEWKAEHGAKVNETADHFGVSLATIKRYLKVDLKEMS